MLKFTFILYKGAQLYYNKVLPICLYYSGFFNIRSTYQLLLFQALLVLGLTFVTCCAIDVANISSTEDLLQSARSHKGEFAAVKMK